MAKRLDGHLSPGPGSPGFTLAEVIVVMMLTSLVLVSLGAIYGTGIRQQLSAMRRNVIQNRALMAMRALQLQIGQATVIQLPPVGTAATGEVAGGINVDAAGNTLLQLTGGEDRQWFDFCVAQGAKCPASDGFDAPCLWSYLGTGVSPVPPTGIPSCGDSFGGAAQVIVSAPLVAPGTTNPLTQPFGRPTNNVITAQFDLRRAGANASPQLVSPDIITSVNLSLQTRMPMQ